MPISIIWKSPGGNTPQGTNYTATCFPSRKLSTSDEPDMQDTAGEAGTSSYVIYSYGPSHMARQKQDDQLEHAYSSYVRIQDVALKTCQRRWTIGRSSERSVPVAWHDDDDDIYIYELSNCACSTEFIYFPSISSLSSITRDRSSKLYPVWMSIYIYIYIVIHKQKILLYPKSSI